MPEKRVLLLYVHERSGHHQAALAIRRSILSQSPGSTCQAVNAIRAVHPFLEKFLQSAYLEMVKKKPDLWRYLYDNPRVYHGTRKLRELIQRSHTKKIEGLLLDFSPTDIVCTQAFPAAVIAEFKRCRGLNAAHYAVLTDFFPHSYWPSEGVDRYFVPSSEAKEKLVVDGFDRERVRITGIPIDSPDEPRIEKPAGGRPQVLLMGGSQGLGPLEKTLRALNGLDEDLEIVVLTGLNKDLFNKLNKLRSGFKKNVKVVPFTENITPYLKAATLLITKPGGLTVAQALAFGTPMIFIEPIPGQETKNAEFLLSRGAALEAASEKDAALQTGLLLRAPARLEALKKNMAVLAHPDAARLIALEILSGEQVP